MSVIAAALQHMLAAGMPADAIVAAVAAMEECLPAVETRSPAAIRQARYRHNKASQNVTNVTLVTESVTDAPPPSPPNKSPPDPQKLTPPPTPPRNPRPRKGASGFELPDRIPGEEWRGYEEMRNRIGKPMTDHAKALAVSRLDKMAEAGWPPGVVLNHSILNNYQGLFAPKDDNDGRQRTNTVGRFGREAISGRTVAAGAAFVAAGH